MRGTGFVLLLLFLLCFRVGCGFAMAFSGWGKVAGFCFGFCVVWSGCCCAVLCCGYLRDKRDGRAEVWFWIGRDLWLEPAGRVLPSLLLYGGRLADWVDARDSEVPSERWSSCVYVVGETPFASFVHRNLFLNILESVLSVQSYAVKAGRPPPG